MNLNKSNGYLSFDTYLVKPSYTIRDFKNEFPQENLELWTVNKKWITYRLEISMKFILLIRFFDDDIKIIEIYLLPKPDINIEMELKDLLKSLGGERNYPWGNIELNSDVKADYKSIIISMNPPPRHRL